MTLRVVPEGLAATGAAVDALAARLAAAQAAAAPVISAVTPPAADPVSLQAAMALSMRGAEHASGATQGIAELGRAGLGVSESGAGYAAVDAHAALSYPSGSS